MDEYEEYEGGSSVNKILIILVILLVLAIAAGCVYFFFIRKEPEPEESSKIGYSKVGVALTQEELNAAMAEARDNAANNRIALKYQNEATSTDGTNFDCYICNSERNLYDMFITIFADAEQTDQIYLSGLIPRGGGLTELELEHPLDEGDHTVYVVVTQVDRDDEGTESIVAQMTHTIEFHVV